MQYHVNGLSIEYFCEGDKIIGEPVTLSEYAIDLTKETAWHDNGYTIAKLFPPQLQSLFESSTRSLLIKLWKEAGLNVPDGFPLHHYHLATSTQELHLKAIDKTKLLLVDQFPVDIRLLEERISDILKVPLKVHNPFDNQKVFHFRVIRPKRGDNNPLHRDVWLEDYKDCINLYIPVAGSNDRSSLILARGSHLWPESRVERTKQGAVVNGQKFNVPGVTGIIGSYELVRPDPQPGEVLLFSPYLIHGGSVNFNESSTRISIEIRLWKQ